MHIVNSFLIREIAGECVAVPIGQAAAKFSGIISLNDSAVFLLRQLETEQTEETLLKALMEEFDVQEDTARQDISEFLSAFSSLGLLTDDQA